MTPWKILGIKAGSDRDTIRRAYARKLKGLNPEDDPDGFMRLRQAHDDALAQLNWRQTWSPDPEPAAPAPLPEPAVAEAPPAADPARQSEKADLAERQAQFLDAIAAGPDGQVAAFEHLLAAPALAGITARDRIEGWIAAAISRTLPDSDPVVMAAITHFGWGEIGSAARGPDVAALLQRREEGEFVARIARPHTELHLGYKALSRPPRARWLARLGAVFGGSVPAETRQILALADGPLPGIANWLNSDAMAFWRDWHSKPRLRLWMFLVMFPLAAVALVAVLEPTGWPRPVQMGLGLIAYAAPFALLWLLGFRQRFLADWQRPDWQYRGWLYAAVALPLVAALWPPVGWLAPLWLILVALAVALTLISVQRLLPDAPGTLMLGLIRAWPAWFFLAVLLTGPPVPAWAKPVLGLLVPAMAIIWWQGGDELGWAAQRRLGRFAPWLLTGAAALLTGAVWGLIEALRADASWTARAMALLVLALLLAQMGVRLAQGWQQLLPAAVMLALLMVATAAVERLRPGRPRDAALPAAQPQALGTMDSWVDARPYLQGRPPGAYRFRVDISIDPVGRVQRCTLEQGTGVVPLDRALCPAITARARYRPARDAKGVPVAAGLKLSGGWTVRDRLPLSPGPRATTAPLVAEPAPDPTPAPRLREPVITCPAVTDTGPMIAEPCMRDRWIGDGDYPAAALAQGQSGKVGYRLLIDAAGRVERCDIVQSSGHAALDKGTCELIRRRARFVPARGADGQPMEWSYRSGVDWELANR